MDYFAHGIWSYIFFHRTKKPFYAVLFGLLPDTLSWFIYFVYRLVASDLRLTAPDLGNIPDWVFTLYGLSHSLIISSLVILLVYLIVRKLPIYMLAWPIAILMDIPTHSREFLPTPFLWPISAWYFPGFSWGTRWFMILNYSLITICLVYIIWWRKKKKN